MFKDISVETNGKQMLTELNIQETTYKQCVNLLMYIGVCVCVCVLSLYR